MTTNWIEQNRELFRALRLERVVTFIVIALIVIVAALQHSHRSHYDGDGEDPRHRGDDELWCVEPGQVRRIFLMEGLLIRCSRELPSDSCSATSPRGQAAITIFIHLSAEVYSIDTLPFAPRPLDGVIVAAVSIGISLLATVYPASAAARVPPRRSAQVRVAITAE